MIALELEVLAKKFDRFGWDRDRGSAAHDRLVMDWMDALQDYPLDEVKAACRAAVIASPRHMPNEGAVIAEIMAARKRHVASLPKPHVPFIVAKDELSADERRRVAEDAMRAAGFAVKRFGGAE
jgi:hypothetical protein